MPNSAPEVFQGYFRKRRHFFSKKLKFWTFGDCMSNINFWKAFWRKISLFSVFENFQVFFEKNISFSKKPVFKRLENSWAIVKIETQLKKTCKIKRFQKLSNFFLRAPSICSKITYFRRLRVFLGCNNFWYIF